MSGTEYTEREALVELRNLIQESLDRTEMQGVHRDVWTAGVALEIVRKFMPDHDQRVRAEQREKDAQIGHDAAAQWVDEWQPNSHKNSHIEDCVATEIRGASDE